MDAVTAAPDFRPSDQFLLNFHSKFKANTGVAARRQWKASLSAGVTFPAESDRRNATSLPHIGISRVAPNELQAKLPLRYDS
ncbi:hypothetical protein QOZ99_003070 [Angulomicrobium amanitiforme]|uniref:Uncharacterized protein n=1 Tax=Ancylobacter amanitiformis TaxID=217069 RepID=A0ABU0LTX7_9HYPH|nr:hypothetical protein [Ancylobacter amanitiformis]